MSTPSKLSARARWGIVLIVGALCILAILAAAPFAWRHMLQTQLDERHQLLALIESKIGGAEKVHGPTILGVADADRVYVSGTTVGLATANFQKMLVDIATANGERVERIQSLPTENKDGLAQLRLEIATVGDIEGLRGYLFALESATPLLFIGEAHLSVPTATAENSGKLPSENLAVTLQVDAFGWWSNAP